MAAEAAAVVSGGHRRPLLSASVGPAAAAVLQAFVADEQGRRRMAGYRAAFAAVDPQANRELTESLEQIAELARQWGQWQHAAPSVSGSNMRVSAEAGGEWSAKELTAGQAAERIGCTPRRVGQLIGEGRLVARKSGRSWLVESTSLEAYVNGRSET